MSTLQERLRAMQNKAAADAAYRLDELEEALEQARVALRGARASLHEHSYYAGIIAEVNADLRAIEEVRE